MDARKLLEANYALVQRAIVFTCRRFGFGSGDAQEFASNVNLHFVEKDYAVIRAWEGRSSLKTFIGAVVHRLALDYRIHTWGKWHPSAEAKRLGALAVELEQLLYRDRRTIEDAFVILAARHEGATFPSLIALAARLPERAPRHRDVDLDEAASIAATQNANPEDHVLDDERRAFAQHVSNLMAAAILDLPAQDRLILQLRYEDGMTVPQIARALKLEQRLIYHRIDRCKLDLRKELERSRISVRDVADLTGGIETFIRFSFGKRSTRPSRLNDETETADSEDPQ